MSFKNFNDLNTYIQTMHEDIAKLTAISDAANFGLSLRNSLKSITDAYARQYSLVQQIQYDADGNIQDVTSVDRQSVPDSVIHQAIDTAHKIADSISNISHQDIETVAYRLTNTPIASLYEYYEHPGPGASTTKIAEIRNYCILPDDNTLQLSDAFIDAVHGFGLFGDIFLTHGSAKYYNPLSLSIPYPASNDVVGKHQLKLISGDITAGSNGSNELYLLHTGSFNAWDSLPNMKSKNLFDKNSYANNGIKTVHRNYKDSASTSEESAIVCKFPGNPIYYLSNSPETRIKSIEFTNELAQNGNIDAWGLMTSLADNSGQIITILQQML